VGLRFASRAKPVTTKLWSVMDASPSMRLRGSMRPSSRQTRESLGPRPTGYEQGAT
jgi:hypothetical protein